MRTAGALVCLLLSSAPASGSDALGVIAEVGGRGAPWVSNSCVWALSDSGPVVIPLRVLGGTAFLTVERRSESTAVIFDETFAVCGERGTPAGLDTLRLARRRWACIGSYGDDYWLQVHMRLFRTGRPPRDSVELLRLWRSRK